MKSKMKKLWDVQFNLHQIRIVIRVYEFGPADNEAIVALARSMLHSHIINPSELQLMRIHEVETEPMKLI